MLNNNYYTGRHIIIELDSTKELVCRQSMDIATQRDIPSPRVHPALSIQNPPSYEETMMRQQRCFSDPSFSQWK